MNKIDSIFIFVKTYENHEVDSSGLPVIRFIVFIQESNAI